MEKTTKTVEMLVLRAAEGMVLCDGISHTSPGGAVYAPAGDDLSSWVEMTEAEADALIAQNTAEQDSAAAEGV